MIDSDFDRIEAALGISLPQGYLDLMLARADELQNVAETHPFFAETLFLEADQVISYNLNGREEEHGTAYAFPRWWKKFFLVGTNGGGDYFCLRLTGDTHVWMIGSDCGNKPSKESESFASFVDERIRDYVDPEPLPSSFDDSIPLLQRFQFALWDDHCKVRPLEGDRPLTAETLRQHGIDVADLERCVQAIVAALANRAPADVRISDEQLPPGDNGELRIPFHAPALSDARLSSANVDIYGGFIRIDFRLSDESPKKPPSAEKLRVDWPAFEREVLKMLEIVHPPGTRVTLTKPKPNSGEAPYYEWTYTLNYSLKPRRPH